MSIARDRYPRGYAASKLSTLRRRYESNVKTAIDTATRAGFPNADAGAMALAMLGFTAFSTGPTENTTEAVRTQSFHEVGLFQCPAGPRNGPAPNTDPRADHNAYGRLAGTDLVKRMMGAPTGSGATMRPDAWKRDIPSQVAVGIANLLDDEASLRRRIGDLCGSTTGWSHWRLWCMFTAFSRGPGQASAVLQPYRAELSAVPESTRLRKLRELVVRDITRGASGIGTRKGKMGTAYAIVRSDQKIESANAIARAVGTTIPFLTELYTASPEDTRAENVITETAYGVSVAAVADTVVEAASNVAQIMDHGDVGTKIVTLLVTVGGAFAGLLVIRDLVS